MLSAATIQSEMTVLRHKPVGTRKIAASSSGRGFGSIASMLALDARAWRALTVRGESAL